MEGGSCSAQSHSLQKLLPAGCGRSTSSTIEVLHGRGQPELPRIVPQINIITAAEREWAGNLNMKGTRTEFKL